MHPISMENLEKRLLEHSGSMVQGIFRDVNQIMKQIAKTNFKRLKKSYLDKKLKKCRTWQLKTGFSIITVGLGILAVIASIVSMIFTSGFAKPIIVTISGLVGVSTAFYQLDQAMIRYLTSLREEKTGKKIRRLLKNLEKIKELIAKNITILKNFELNVDHYIIGQIFLQIKKFNEFIDEFNRVLPNKIGISRFDPSGLVEIIKKRS